MGPSRPRISLLALIGWVTVIALVFNTIRSQRTIRRLQNEVEQQRDEVGYVRPSGPDEIAAARAPSDEPLVYKFRVRVPDLPRKYRLAYGTIFPKGKSAPQWHGAVAVPPGESRVIVRIMEDPRDRQWKVAAIVAGAEGTRRMGTVLPDDQVTIFRGSHERMRTGVDRETVIAPAESAIRLLDERWLVGEGALMLFGDRPPDRDQIGVYAELQCDRGTLGQADPGAGDGSLGWRDGLSGPR